MDGHLMSQPRLAPGEHGQPWTTKRPNGRWRATVRVRGRDGRVRQLTATEDTKGAALRALQRKLTAWRPETSANGVKPAMTVDELSEYWLKHRRTSGSSRSSRPLRPQSLAGYAKELERVVSPALGAARIDELSVGLLDSIVAELESAGVSTRIARSVLSQMLELAVRHGALAANPMASVAKPYREPPEVEALSIEDVRRLRRLTRPETQHRSGKRGPNRDLGDFIDLALATGARIGEVLALRWQDLDLDSTTPTATICGTVVEPRKGYVDRLHRQDATKSGSTRSLILGDAAVAVLRERRTASRYTSANDPVFASGRGRWLWPNNIRTRLRAAIEGTELAGTTPHTLRRTVATRIAHEAGLDAAIAQLGHSHPSLAFQIYVAPRDVAPDVRHVLDDLLSDVGSSSRNPGRSTITDCEVVATAPLGVAQVPVPLCGNAVGAVQL